MRYESDDSLIIYSFYGKDRRCVSLDEYLKRKISCAGNAFILSINNIGLKQRCIFKNDVSLVLKTLSIIVLQF